MGAPEPMGETGPRCDPVTQILCLERERKKMVWLLKSSLVQHLVSKAGCHRVGTLPGDLITNIQYFIKLKKMHATAFWNWLVSKIALKTLS